MRGAIDSPADAAVADRAMVDTNVTLSPLSIGISCLGPSALVMLSSTWLVSVVKLRPGHHSANDWQHLPNSKPNG